jgi:crotonobetainyl-CoA:carnitine CoA-transferase CaiB-like acyl-CoA transferase
VTETNQIPPGALDGIRVVDLTTVLMGPLSTRMLGDHGADVVRIETAGGDSTRSSLPSRHEGMSGFALNLQRNKRSLVLDLKSEAGMEVLWRLLGTADAIVTNMRRGALNRLGLGPDDVRSRLPGIIYCGANGFGSGGRRRDEAAYDDAIQAASGLAGVVAQARGGTPDYVPAVIADKVVGLHIVQAVMAALIHKLRTGEGQAIEVPMFETMVAFNLIEHHRGAVFDPPLGPFGYDRLMSPHRHPFQTADGWMCLLPYTTGNWQDFLAFIGRNDLLTDERFLTHNARIANIDTLYGLVDEYAASRTTAEWLEFCDRVSIPAAKVLDLAEVDDDPHLQDVGLIEIIEHPTEGRYRVVHDAVKMSESPTALRRHAPRLGEHSNEILAELGYDEAARAELATKGAMGT